MRKKQLDPAEVAKMASIGATIAEMCSYFGCGHAHLNRHYQRIIEEGRASGILAAKGRLYRRAMGGQTAALEFYLANTAGWSPKPSVAITNVVQNNAGGLPGKSAEETREHMVMLQKAILLEARKQLQDSDTR